jgi:ATPase subunit of ABC transporter with duplicated ATPase domains
VFGTYDQKGIQWDDDELRVFDFVKQKVESSDGNLAESPQESMKLLKQFQFDRSRWNER